MKNILFTGGRAPATLDLVRLFNKKNYNVFIAETFKNNITGSSKHVKKNLIVPSPALETKRFIESLIDIIIEYKIDLLIPTCEEVFYISQHLETLEKYCRVFTSNIDILINLHSKYKFIDLLKKLNIDHPKTKILSDKYSLQEELNNTENFVLKPEYSRFASSVIINDKKNERLKDLNISEKYKWVFQEYIKGKAFCSYSVAEKGEVKAHSVYPGIYCVDKGATIHFKFSDIPEIEEIVKKIVKELNYTGQIAFDFIKSDKNGIYYPIECNPRATSGIHLFSEEVVEGFISNKEKIIYPDKNNKKMIALAMLLFIPPYLRSVNDAKSFVKEFYNSKDVVFNLKDIKPFIKQFKQLKFYSDMAKKHNVSLTEAIMIDMEWNGNL